MPYLGIFDQKCLTWVFLGLILKKTFPYLKSAFFNLSWCKVWCKNKNSQIWEQKRLTWVFLG